VAKLVRDGGYHSDGSVLRSYTVSLRKKFPTFRRIVLPSNSGSSSARIVQQLNLGGGVFGRVDWTSLS
jgi:hypothetical protein